MSKSILIVDDHPVTRAGIRSIVETEEGLSIVGEAKDGLEAIDQAKKLQPDVVIMDISMPQLSGIDATKEIHKLNPAIKVIVLSIHSGQKYVTETLNAGAVGYLLKDEAAEELLTAINKILSGNMYLSPAVTRVALEGKKTEADNTGFQVLKTKLQRPPVWHDYIERKRITDELERNLIKPFSLISAGAGYGKSVAVSQWLENTERIHAWISLDEEHNEMRIFLSYLMTAIQQIIPGSMIETEKAIRGTELPAWKDLLYITFNDLFDLEDELILVLDDYHKISEERIHDFFNEWLSFPPPNIHLSIITRRDPNLNLNILRLNDRMTEIRMDALSFSNDEILLLFHKILGVELKDTEIRLLQEKTEGWIIALRLATMLVKSSDQLEGILEGLAGGLQNISEYLIAEVLSNLPHEMQHPILMSSISNRFCGELLDTIFGSQSKISGKEMISFLRKSNIFLIDLDRYGKWFRFHHLFQDLLQTQLAKHDAEAQIKQYHLRASRWFEDHGYLEEAIDHVLTIGDLHRAGFIIKRHRLALLNSNNYYQLEHLQRKLPMSVVESDPGLVLIEMYLQWNHGNFPRLGELEELLKEADIAENEETEITAESYFFTGFNAFFLRGDLATSLEKFNIAMEVMPGSSAEPRGLLELHYMIFGQLGGLYEKNREMYYELIDQDIAPLRKNRIFQGFLAASLDQANLAEIESNYARAISFARKSTMKDSLGIILFMAGDFMARKGFWKGALACFDEVLEIRYFVHSRITIDSLTGLIITNMLMNQKSKAEEVISVLEKYVQGLGDFFKTFLHSTMIRYHMLIDDREKVISMLKDFTPDVLDIVLWIDVPEITRARALIYEGSEKNLIRAEEELTRLEGVTTALHNRLHLLEVKVLQAILLKQKGDLAGAKEALQRSLAIAEPEEMVLNYVELGSSFKSLIDGMPEDIKASRFVKRIIKEIDNRMTMPVKPATEKSHEKLNVLTRKEMQVLACVAEGLRNREISEKLFNSEETIKKHIYNMFQKMHVKNRLSLVAKAREEGFLGD
jgi:LuxR family maltose regulon positive regulatory protein